MSRFNNILVAFAVVSIVMASCSKLEPLNKAECTEVKSVEMNTKASTTPNGVSDTGNGITDPDHDEDHDKDNTSLTK